MALVVTNNTDAGVLEIAKSNDIPFLIVNKKTFQETLLLEQLSGYNPDLIVLAGFLWKIPPFLLSNFANKIINIHPALLPKYGGKGMYGKSVHDAVIAAGDSQSGITIHYVDDKYDNGMIIMQATCTIDEHCTTSDLALKIRKLEHYFFPRVIEFILDNH